MGGCSSKPKTAEFEGSMETQEDKPQDEAVWKSAEVEKTEQQPSARSIQTLLTETERGDLRDMFAVTDKQMIAGFSSKGNFKDGRQLIEDDHQHVKQILEETVNDSGAEKGHNVKKEIFDVQINPGFITGELHEDPVLVMEVTKNIKEKPPIVTTEAETVNTQKEPLTLSKETLENEEKGVFSESSTLSLKDTCSSTAEDALKLQMNQGNPQDVHLELSNNLSAGGETISELQKVPFLKENCPLWLHKEAHMEAISNGKVESNYHEAFFRNDKQRLDVRVGYEGQDNHVVEGSNEREELRKETEAVACEVVHAANGSVSALERHGKVLKDSSKPMQNDEIKGMASAKELIIGTCIVKNSPFADVSNQERSREIDSTDATHPAIPTSASPNNLQHIVDEQVLVQEEQEVDVDAAYKIVMKDAKPQANLHLVNDFLMKESNVETLDTTSREGELVSAKIYMDDKASLLVSEEPLDVQLLVENSLGKVQDEKSNAAVMCIEGEQKLDVSCTPDEVTASQVTATTKKPEVQSVHVKEFAELALSPAQDIPAPDIDEVLEKLASEFERQESLARATS